MTQFKNALRTKDNRSHSYAHLKTNHLSGLELYKIITCESVCAGHPDKICDIIADSILDYCLLYDKDSRVACEVMIGNNLVVVQGEVTTQAVLNDKIVSTIVYNILEDLGYDNSFKVIVNLSKQSADIALGVDNDFGAGDQGTVFGYATNENEEQIPMPLLLSHKICQRLDECRRNNIIEGILSDGKAQVSVAYNEAYRPTHVDSIVVSVQHVDGKDLNVLRQEVKEKVLLPVLNAYKFVIPDDDCLFINHTGRFVVGGPFADCGVTNRKTVVDSYGGVARHGGGGYSGKDFSKVDRSGAYLARSVCKLLVDKKYCDRVEISVSYCIGKKTPVAVNVECFGSNSKPMSFIQDFVSNRFDFSSKQAKDLLGLDKPIYSKTASYGHFGVKGYPWEDVRLLGEF